MTRRQFFYLLIVAFVLRVPMLFWTPLWYDENYTLTLARLPFASMLQAVAGDVHPPLWYALEWGIYHIFPSAPAWALRLPALAFSIASIWIFGRVIYLLNLSSRVQAIALVIMALVPMQIYYASEGRMYSLLCLLVLTAVYAVLTYRWGLFCIVGVMLALTQNWGLFYLCALGVFVLVKRYLHIRQAARDADPENLHYEIWIAKDDYDRFFYAALVIFICWLPWLQVLRWQMDAIKQSYWITRVTPGLVIYNFYQQIWAMSLPHPIYMALTFAMLLFGIYLLRRRWDVLLLACGPLALGVIVSLLYQPVILYRALIGISPFVYTLLAAALAPLMETPRRRLLAAIAIVPMLITALPGMYINAFSGAFRNGALDMLQVVTANYQPGDVIASLGDQPIVNLQPYTNIPLYLVDTGCPQALGALTAETRQGMEYNILPYDQIPARRVWFIGGTSPLVYQCEVDAKEKLTTGITPVYEVPDQGAMLYTALWLLEK